MFCKVTERKGARSKSEVASFVSAEVQGMYRMPLRQKRIHIRYSSLSTILSLPWPTIAGPLSLHYIGLSLYNMIQWGSHR
jgi:hypothetical protein